MLVLLLHNTEFLCVAVSSNEFFLSVCPSLSPISLLWLGWWHQVEGITAAYTQEKAGYEAMSAEMDKTKAEFTVFERKDIKLKEDIKHIKAKDKKLKETIVKEKEKADKARESIPKQVPKLCLCLSACVHCVDMHLASSLRVAECWWMETGEGHCGG
jgi:hypothetical protein